jgi:hypothetical protein
MANNNNHPIDIIIGKIAFDWLQQSDHAFVWGVTSGGIFLKVHNAQIIFLTTSGNFGPINIILPHSLPESWKNEDLVQITLDGELIRFNHSQGFLTLKIRNICNTPPAPDFNISMEEQQFRIQQAARQLSILKNNQGFSPLILPFISKVDFKDDENTWLNQKWRTIQNLWDGLKVKKLDSVLKHASQLIGSGRGLTPSGDDLLTGLFFMHKRWFNGNYWLNSIKETLLDNFANSTTAVSHSLFYCALLGEADASIQRMCDSLMNIDIPYQYQAIELARWGNSSGADLFMGIILAIDCFQE